MIVFICYIFLICFTSFFCCVKNDFNFEEIKLYKKVTLLIPMLYLFAVMGLKSIKVGADTERYVEYLRSFSQKNFTQVLSEGYDFGFNLFNKLMIVFCQNNYTIYFLTIYAFVCFSLYVFISQNSKDYCVSQLMLLSLGFTFFFFTGLRQTIAMSILMHAYNAQKKRKFVWCILLTVLAATFHSTALIFLLILPIRFIKFRKAIIFVAPVFVILAYIFQAQIFSFFSSLLPDDLYDAYGKSYISSVNMTGLIIQITIFVVSLFYLWKHLNQDNEANFLLNVYVIGMVFQAMTGTLAEFFRLSMYFSIFGVILIPKALSYLKKGSRTVISFGMCSVFIVYFIFFSSTGSGVLPYSFFWSK